MCCVVVLGGIVVVCDVDYVGFFWFLVFLEFDCWFVLYCVVVRVNGGEFDVGC